MSSQALAGYLMADSAVEAVLRMELNLSNPPSEQDRSAAEGLRGGAAVLMVAAFENYLREAISEAISQMNDAQPPYVFDKLPDQLRTIAVYSALELAMRGDYRSAGRKRLDRLPDIFTAVQKVHSRQIDGAAIAQTKGNPDSQLVRQLFKTLGVPNVFSNVKRSFDAIWGTPTASTFIPDTLDIVVNRRHVVAHTASALAITRFDLGVARVFVTCLVTVLDQALERQTTRVLQAAR